MRAPCLADEVALAYTDRATCSTLIETSSVRCSSTRAKYIPRRARSTVSRFALALLFIALSHTTVHGLFDPGESVQSQQSGAKEATASDTNHEKPRRRADAIKLSEQLQKSVDTSLALNPVSLHPGCRRTTDLFANVCQSPWSSWSQPRLTSSLVVCPLPDAEPLLKDDEVGETRPRERVYAISGTITLPDDVLFEEVTQNSQQKTIGDAGKDVPWPKPGDEGFWRQRGGNLEWVPAVADPRYASEYLQDTSPASSASSSESSTPSSPSSSSEAAQAKEYHAWSASIGGEDSDLWLRFDQWKDNYLAQQREREREEHEKQRAAGRKAKDRAKASHASNSTDTSHDQGSYEAAIPADDGASTTKRPDGHESGDNIHTEPVPAHNEQPSSSTSHPVPTPSEEGRRDEQDLQATAVLGSQHSAAAASAAAAAETGGSIPAMGDAASELVHLKHRFNFASFDCAAAVHRSNPSAKFASSILSEKKDRYMLSPCPSDSKEGQFVIVELCDEIMIDTLVLANYEFFSRMFKRFRVRVARSLQGREDEWYEIGTFRARNVRGMQVFKTVHPKADSRFFRYVRIDFLEHYGSEYYCPVSLLRVYGLTQMDDYIREEEEMRKQVEREKMLLTGELDEDEEESEGGDAKEQERVVENDARSYEPPHKSEDGQNGAGAHESDQDQVTDPSKQSVVSSAEQNEARQHLSTATAPDSSTSSAKHASYETPLAPNNETRPSQSAHSSRVTQEVPISHPTPASPSSIDSRSAYTPNVSKDLSGSSSPARDHAQASTSTSQAVNATMSDSTRAENATYVAINATSGSPIASWASNDDSTVASSAIPTSSHSPQPAAETNTRASSAGANGNGGSNSNSNSGSSGGGGSESIYRTITKRLNALETNATLSVQYMEHSRQMLRDIFARMEKRQDERMAEMLRALNESNWRQIDNLKRRQQVDLQQAIFEFDLHRQQTDAERSALVAQVHILSNEVILEKRYGMAQLVLLLGLFVFMALTRGSRAAPMLHSSLSRLSGVATPKLRRNRSPVSSNDHRNTHQGDATAKSQFASSMASAPVREPGQAVLTRSGGADRSRRESSSGARRSQSRNHQYRASSKRDKRVVIMAPVSEHKRSMSNGEMQKRKHADETHAKAENAAKIEPKSTTTLGNVSDNKENVKPELPRISIARAQSPNMSREDYSVMTDEELRAYLRLSTPTGESYETKFRDLKTSPVSTSPAKSPALSPKHGKIPLVPDGSAITDESFSSDWGTERSSEEEPDESIDHGRFVSSPPRTPVRGGAMATQDAYGSDAEEDAPMWQHQPYSSVKHNHHLGRSGSGRRRRPTSSGSTTGSIRSLDSFNGGNRTPQRLASPLGR